ncbi:MAG: hypothetical protein E6H84_03575 [Chloroflexi bacterium]|nr:MAG: hypothetical protein E6H84_03575 [Chloroflexota bacterium]
MFVFVTGQPLPRLVVSNAPLRLTGRFSPRLRETVASAHGVTFWASDAKARAELGRTRAACAMARGTRSVA